MRVSLHSTQPYDSNNINLGPRRTSRIRFWENYVLTVWMDRLWGRLGTPIYVARRAFRCIHRGSKLPAPRHASWPPMRSVWEPPGKYARTYATSATTCFSLARLRNNRDDTYLDSTAEKRSYVRVRSEREVERQAET